jgi:hypothetical protein
VIKLPKSDFFVPKLLVFSITFGRKTKKSQPLRMTVHYTRRMAYETRRCVLRVPLKEEYGTVAAQRGRYGGELWAGELAGLFGFGGALGVG